MSPSPSDLVTPDDESPITATFQAQRIREGHAEDVGAARVLDVTDKILAMPLDRLAVLRDNDTSSDALVSYDQHLHNGIFRVQVVDSACRYFGVDRLSKVTGDMLHDARCLRRAHRAQARVPMVRRGPGPLRGVRIET